MVGKNCAPNPNAAVANGNLLLTYIETTRRTNLAAKSNCAEKNLLCGQVCLFESDFSQIVFALILVVLTVTRSEYMASKFTGYAP